MPRNEAATRRELIDPKIRDRGWTEDLIKIERTIGGTDIIDGTPYKRAGRTDYLLCLPGPSGMTPLPVAILEAKKEELLPSLGIQQAQTYRQRFNVPFIFSSNGHLYAEWAEDTNRVADDQPLEEFPSPDELRDRYEAIKGFDLASDEAQPLFASYRGGDAARYYFQDAAIRAALEKVASGGNRVLMSLATGTGKTIVAAQLLHKLAETGQLRRALFVCDRDELRTQGWSKMRAVFGDNAQIATTSDPSRNARIVVASYQTLNIADEDAEPTFWKENYPPDYFSHIIIDECHRSAWGKWSIVLTDNPDAVQVGLTATPRVLKGSAKDEDRQTDEAITAHNLEYFGDPVYEYPMWLGQEDGYLAASEVIRRVVDLDKDDITKEDIEALSARDALTGQKIDPVDIEPRYTRTEYEEKLLLPDRVSAMCSDLFDLLLETGGPHQKTIIFGVTDRHATLVTHELNNIYASWCENNGVNQREFYTFQCTGNPDLRPSASYLIPEFRGSKSSHYIATTVDLLSTGVDVPDLLNVVFFQYLRSPIEFYQRIGRGTRTGEPRGSKLMFRIYDYTDASRLFGEDFISRARPSSTDKGETGPEAPDPNVDRPMRRVLRVEGFEVHVEGQGRSIVVEEDGREALIPVEEFELRLAEALTDEVADLDNLRLRWVSPEARRALVDKLPGDGGSVRMLRAIRDQDDCDVYDVLAELGYGVVARSRSERVASFSHKHRGWLRSLPVSTAEVVVAMGRQFERGGIEELETPDLFDIPEIVRAGGFDALGRATARPEELIIETKERLLAP